MQVRDGPGVVGTRCVPPPTNRPQLDPRRLSQDGAGAGAFDLGQQGVEAGAAVGAGQVEALQGLKQAGGRVFGRHDPYPLPVTPTRDDPAERRGRSQSERSLFVLFV